MRITNPGGASINNYFSHVTKAAGTDTIQLWKTVTNTQTQLGADGSQEVASGDSFGIDANGTTITAWYKPAAGSWTAVMVRTDSGVTAAGYIGLVAQSNSAIWDDFGGGTINARELSTMCGQAVNRAGTY